jgi:hypothetical protein
MERARDVEFDPLGRKKLIARFEEKTLLRHPQLPIIFF